MTENTENVDESTVAPIPVPEVVTKQSIRRKIWEHLEKNNLVNFPRPVYGRIPNFKGCELAAEKAAQLDVFKNAQNIKVNPDKPQEPVRFTVLDNQKNLYVPIPRLASGLLKHITVPENAVKDDIRKAVSRKGIDENGKEVGLGDDAKIDLVILGSVAVTKEGYRIGKGRGYADLEFAILQHMGAVTSDTVVVTTVHDCQVLDAERDPQLSAPVELFGPHDVPVDIIVTPTRVLHVENRLPRPVGIIWPLLSQRRLEMMPVLQMLKEQDVKAGKEVTLKEIDSDVENQPPYSSDRPQRRGPLRRHRRPRNDGAAPAGGRRARGGESESQPGEDGEGAPGEGSERQQPPRRRRYPRRRQPNSTSSSQPGAREDGQADAPALGEQNGDPNSPRSKRRPNQKRNFRKNRSMIDFSLMVRNIEKSVRVRDLKAALAERGIKPNVITWRGFKGYCCLHFSKTNPNTISDPEQKSHGVDNVIGLLQNLKVSPDSKKNLSVEIMRPISRIETTDVTSV